MKIVVQPHQRLFFTSDTHYAHKNICSATTEWKDPGDSVRQFNSLDEMNSTIVNNINEMVGEDDILMHGGDWSFGGFDKIEEFRSQLICKNIHIVCGNHDHHIANNKDGIQSLFASVNHYIPELDVRVIQPDNSRKRYTFCVFHFPIASWIDMNKGVIHLHGHTHLPHHLKIGEGRSIDFGMDGNGLKPYELTELFGLVRNQPVRKLVLPKDHHETRLV